MKTYRRRILVSSERDDILNIVFVGDQMSITFNDGHTCIYKYKLISEVPP